MIRICRKCGEEKDIKLFAKCERCSYNRSWTCKQCVNKNNKKWRENNKEKMEQCRKNWVLKNPEKAKEITTKSRRNNIEKTRERRRRWGKENPKKLGIIKSRCKAKRKRNLGFIPLNKKFNGADGHHIDKQHVIYIPKELHMSIPHNQTDLESMEKINELAFNYLTTQGE